MTLKGVHVLFIVLSMALAAFMAIWALGVYLSPAGGPGHLATAVAATVALVALGGYAIQFVRKARRLGLD